MKKSPIFLTRRAHSDSVLDQVSSSAFFRALFSNLQWSEGERATLPRDPLPRRKRRRNSNLMGPSQRFCPSSINQKGSRSKNSKSTLPFWTQSFRHCWWELLLFSLSQNYRLFFERKNTRMPLSYPWKQYGVAPFGKTVTHVTWHVALRYVPLVVFRRNPVLGLVAGVRKRGALSLFLIIHSRSLITWATAISPGRRIYYSSVQGHI